MIDSVLLLMWVLPLLSFIVGSVAGVLLKIVSKKYLIRRFKLVHSSPKAEEIFNWTAHRLPLWGMLLGAFFAVHQLPISVSTQSLLFKVIEICFMLIMTWTTAVVVGKLIGLYSWTEDAMMSNTITRVMVQIGIWITGIALTMQAMGVSVAPVLTALGVGGLAVALALQDTLSNLFAGIQIIMAKQIKIGDYVKMESGEEGYVDDIGWRSTVVRALGNNLIIIPNGKLAQMVATNYNLPQQYMTVRVSVGVSYSSDLELVERVTLEVGNSVMEDNGGCLGNFKPFMYYESFNDSSIDFVVRLQVVRFEERFRIIHEFIKRLHKRYELEGIEIPFPQRVVTMAKES